MSIEEAVEVLRIEEEGLAAVRKRIGVEFENAVDIMLSCPTRIIITGIGKSGLVGQKIAATFNSTGTPSYFLHPVEAMHGDLGMVVSSDVIVALSYSGDTVELNHLVSSLKVRGTKIIAMTGGTESSLARAADVVLNVGVPQEACPLGLAPTASTTAALAMGDALAVVLLNKKKFGASDFRENHPGGSLGERLKVEVVEVMMKEDDVPVTTLDQPAVQAVTILNEKNVGAVVIVNEDHLVAGIVTDGDVRRFVVSGTNLERLGVGDLMTADPVCIDGDMLAADALSIMQRHEITILPIVGLDRKLIGVLHLHDLLGKGEFRFLV